MNEMVCNWQKKNLWMKCFQSGNYYFLSNWKPPHSMSKTKHPKSS